ncbi:NAD(P)-binding protein [Lentinus tigrinus ALCF2SS1-7]|uniref:NAD(P)-binding protein n=1 Tax=Lentinus tigrinus ALCF2SS1-6 TaxID=1328759 RepID=A0A5C2S045_9APHY|nr:NAD(P)-binding protein [Lentinus tigrinus ALCF2SS1-6]RPD71624.1 NAD(P)-binding protein [Lentinus tigrinus ALCF2SS1-7]
MGTVASNLWNLWQALSQFYPPKSTFTVEQIPDLSGRVVIVTGGYSGLGYETVKALLQHNAKVYVAGRSKEKAEKAIAALKQETSKDAIFLELNLASLASVKRTAEEFLGKEHELHILFNNAGVMWPPNDLLTEDGYDLQWGTNVLGHWYLTELLMPALLAGVETSPDHHVRVITTSSSGAYQQTINWDTLKDTPARRKQSTENLYYQSKFGNVVVARQVAKRYADRGIISISLNPGNIETDLQRHMSRLGRYLMKRVMLHPTPLGALTQLFAGTMPEALNYNGEYLIPWARLGRCRAEAYDDALGERLWQWLEDEVKAHQPS